MDTHVYAWTHMNPNPYTKTPSELRVFHKIMTDTAKKNTVLFFVFKKYSHLAN